MKQRILQRNVQKMYYVLGNSKGAYNHCKQKNKGFSAPKWDIILLKAQRLLVQEENEDANQCGVIGIVNTK